MWFLRKGLHLLDHLISAKTPGQMHSPFLFELLPSIHDAERHYYIFDEIEALRHEYLNDHEEIEILDFGAGSKAGSGRNTVSNIARASLSHTPRCQLLFRLIAHLKPRMILEMGTSLGIMTAYLASANKDTMVHTIEGNPASVSIARRVAQKLDLHNISFHTGRFADVLPGLTKQIPPPDFILIDGDHRGAALLSYYQQLRPILLTNTVIVVDDIRWSEDMYEGWNRLIADPDITCTLDYFSFGILFFRKEFREKLNLKITHRHWPPTIL